jgi:hypothetical protein
VVVETSASSSSADVRTLVEALRQQAAAPPAPPS